MQFTSLGNSLVEIKFQMPKRGCSFLQKVILVGPPRFERGTYGFLRMTAPEFRHSLSGSSPSERDTALMGVSFLEPVVILDPIDRSVDRLARLRPHGFIQNDIPDFKYMRFCVTERNILPQKKT